MIKLIVNDVELDLKTDTVVALTKKAVDIGNLQNRWSSYTNKFTIPATKKNRDALGLKQFQDASGSQYEYQNGKLISGGLEIASNVLVVIEQVSKEITLTLRAGNGNLFDALNKTKLSDLYWDDLNHKWNILDYRYYINYIWTNGFVYPLHDTGVQSKTKNSVVGEGFIPFLYVKSAFKRIAEKFGYQFIGNTYTDDFFEKLTYPISSLDISYTESNKYTYRAPFAIPPFFAPNGQYAYYPLYYHTGMLYLNQPGSLDPYDYNINDPKDNEWSSDKFPRIAWFNNAPKIVDNFDYISTYLVKFDGTYKVKMRFNFRYRKYLDPDPYNIGQFMKFHLVVYNKDTKTYQIFATYEAPVNNSTTTWANHIFTLDGSTTITGSVLYRYTIGVVVDYRNYELEARDIGDQDPLYPYAGELEVYDIKGIKIQYLGDLDFKSHQPKMTCGKFIKEVANIFGAIYDVDEFKKTIEITRLDEIAANKAIAYDWTDKLDLGQPINVSFKYDGFGKTTVLQWNEDLLYKKELPIANDQLAEKAEYVKSESEYCESKIAFGYSTPLAYIPYWDGTKIEPDDKLRFAIIKSNDYTVSGGGLYPMKFDIFTYTNYKVAYFDYVNSPYSLDWSKLYDKYYADLIGPMTARLQVVECYMKLNDLDIQSFRFKYPIYIKHFNRYFFVNEIAEYTGKTQSTKVLLVGI